MPLNAYVINLDRQPERLKAFYRQADTRDFSRIPAVDKQILALLEPSFLFDTKAAQQYYQRSLTLGEIGCTLSHIKTWQAISKNAQMNEDDFAVIAEDDVLFTDDFVWHIKKLIPLFANLGVDIVKLQRLGMGKDKLFAGGDFQGFYPKKSTECDSACSGLYLITKRKAIELTEQLQSKKPHWLADDFSLFCPLEKIFVANTVLGYTDETLGSDLESERQLALNDKRQLA